MAGAGAVGGQPAFAAEQQRAIEEVIVTAQRAEESIQDVPVAVTALGGEMLEDRQVINPSDLQMNAPNVSFTAANFGGSIFSIRGIGNLAVATTAEAGVSTHVNEIPVSTNLNAVEFFDMERVEVLRGPQGTLFGRNATGGAINFVTRKPEYESVGGFIDGEYGDYDHIRLKGALNLPVTDNFALRIAGMMLDRDGYIENAAYDQQDDLGMTLPGIDDDVDGRDLWSIRATASWVISDRADLWVMYTQFDEDDDRARITNQVCAKNEFPTTGCDANESGFDQPHLGTTTGGIFGGLAGALPFGVAGDEENFPGLNYDFPRPDDVGFRTMHTDFEPVFQNEEQLWTFGFNYDFDRISAGLLGAYQETEFLSRQDYQMNVGPTLNPTALNPEGLWPTSEPDGRAGDDWREGGCSYVDGTFGVEGGCILPVDQSRVFAYDQSDSDSEYWTIEAKVASSFDGPFNFQLGANTYDSESYGDYYVLANTLDLVTSFGTPALGGVPLYPGAFNNTSNPEGGTLQDGWAVFGEAYFDFTPDVKLTVGLRYNEDNKEVSDTSVLYNAFDMNAISGGLLGERVWSRLPNFLLGPLAFAPASVPGEVALAQHYGATSEAIAAAEASAPFSPERFAVASQVPIVPLFGETRALTGSPSEATWDEVTGRVGIDWQLNQESMVYAFFSRGYKPGGFNPAIPPQFQDESSFTFDSEQIDAFEIGTKNTFFNGGLVLNGALFYYDYGNLQVTRIRNNSSLNDNIDATVMGLELETLWQPEAVPGLTVDAAYSWLDSEVDGSQSVDPVNRNAGNEEWILLNNIDPGSATAVNFIARESQINQPIVDAAHAASGALSEANGGTVVPTAYPANSAGVSIPVYWSRTFLNAAGVETLEGLPSDLDGNSLPNSPEHTIKLGVAYTWPIGAIAGSLTARWDYYWQDKAYAREFNTVGDEIDSWDQHNASLIYESDDGRWMGRLWVRNIADDDNVTGKYLTSDTSGFFRNYFLTEPRIYGASVRYSFDRR